ncbi:Fibronectin type-III domain-containing protein 3A [Frankliniella fusca]|uniref:Fibronectin type-III domain-containing protein 3A n=1 Tax=Frankliniella fusca TaxID=407009 RepID=A0AAE1LP17_9NEOP|nr:Fibronectin type-III domain-containing protein 3A [Frankliniella fusca]
MKNYRRLRAGLEVRVEPMFPLPDKIDKTSVNCSDKVLRWVEDGMSYPLSRFFFMMLRRNGSIEIMYRGPAMGSPCLKPIIKRKAGRREGPILTCPWVFFRSDVIARHSLGPNP